MAYYSEEELKTLGLFCYGAHVQISTKASIYNPSKISIGSHVRIDDFCVLSAGDGGIDIGSYVHVAVYSLLIGAGKISLADFSGISSRVSIYSSNDDYSGEFMTNPTVPSDFTNVHHADVMIERHALVGSGSVILPGVTLEEGAVVGAQSLVAKTCKSFEMYMGTPARRIKSRKRGLLKLEETFSLSDDDC